MLEFKLQKHRDYYLHSRKNGIFYVEFVNPESGKKMTARSTGETDIQKAKLKIEIWKANGIPIGKTRKQRHINEIAEMDYILKFIQKSELNATDALKIVEKLKNKGLIDVMAVNNTGRGAVPFIQFLTEFWDYEKSDYIRDRLSHGYRFSKSYSRGCQSRIKSTLSNYFGDKKTNCITKEDLKELSKFLYNKGLATSTINQFLLICKISLKWAYNEGIINENPCLGLTKFSIKNKKRGILSDKEISILFSEKNKKIWKDKRAYVASLVSAFTGARQGECLALRRSDIGIDKLNILYSYSSIDGLKCPKNGETREVILIEGVRKALLDLLNDNPFLEADPLVEDPFIFYSTMPNKPCEKNVIINGFKNALDNINNFYVEEAKRKKLEKPEIQIDYKNRNICFHSWRHWFCSAIDRVVESKKVAKISGHLTESVFKHYADHVNENDFLEVRKATETIFNNIIPLKKAV